MSSSVEPHDLKSFFQREYGLSKNPFAIIPCQSVNEYLDRFNEVDNFIQDLNVINVSGMGANRIVIGNKGTGKTSFMNICILKAKEKGLKTMYIDHAPNTASTFMKKLLRSAAELAAPTDQIRRQRFMASLGRVGGYAKTTDDLFIDWTNMMKRVKSTPVLVFIDETATLPEMRGVEAYFNNYIFEHMKEVVFVLGCTTATYNKISARMGGFVDRFPKVVNLPPFSKEECVECLKKKMDTARIKKSESSLHPLTQNAVESLVELSKGIPRYLIELAFTALNMGATRGDKSVDVSFIEEAAFAVKKSTLHNVWNTLPLPEKNILVMMAKLGGQVNLVDLASAMKKTKPGVWYPLTTLIDCGIVEKLGIGKKEVSYKLTVDPKIVFALSR